MKDFARSDDPAVQAQLDRLAALSVPDGRLGLETIRALLDRLGDPQDRLPPVFHVAGTNGKGSTCAILRAMLEADGKRVHVATSPHLVRYNERIRIAGTLIGDAQLAALLAEVLDASEEGGQDLNPSFFEVTIAATFLAFAREPADACVIEVGLGGRFDATNVLGSHVLAACGIAALGLDHERFLLAPEDNVPAEPLARIGFEKAGIGKPGVPLVTLSYPEGVTLEVEHAAIVREALLTMRGREWHSSVTETGERFHLILGMLANKDHRALVDPLADSIASITAVPVPGHEYHPASMFGADVREAADVAEALRALPDDGLPVLIAGSLYLAGDVLRLSGALPD